MTRSNADEPDVATLALVSLPGMTPARLHALFERWPDPTDAARAVARGHGRPVEGPKEELGWREALDLPRARAQLAARRTRVFRAGDDGYPIADPLPGRPPVLLAEGERPDALGAPRVAVVGTRAATPHGLADARAVGRHLAEHGVTVVSGMAIGVDGAAHDGCLCAGGLAVGVLGTGLDVVYPRRHAALFDRVRAQGVLVSELPYGTRPHRARFPVRNRIIAGLADVVVVVEATASGGARITAERALEYGRAVLAVPGSRRNPAAAGCNALIADGAQPLLDPSDVLLALGMTPGCRRAWEGPPRPRPGGDAGKLLTAFGGEPATADQLCARTGWNPAQVAVTVAALERDGWIRRERGLLWPG